MQGRIMKGIAGFYYVYAQDGLYECKAKGNFRNRRVKPLVGDRVIFEVIDEAQLKGNITDILDRSNELIRPEVSNVDQALIVFAMDSPEPNFQLLDRFLIRMEFLDIPVLICFNKTDLSDSSKEEEIRTAYKPAGYPIHFVCAKTGEGLPELMEALKGRCTVFAGPSGVGKSSLSNALTGTSLMETGDVSRKTQRGKQTTRHSQLLPLKTEGYLMDTPGFTSLMVEDLRDRQLSLGYPEMRGLEDRCRFAMCSHINEPDCGVKDGLFDGSISRLRYENYTAIYKELAGTKRY